MLIPVLTAVLALWMFGCGYAGYTKRFGLFVIIAGLGMGLNTVWMMVGLEAHPLSPPALMAHGAATLYALCALATGWLAGRMVRSFRESRVIRNE